MFPFVFFPSERTTHRPVVICILLRVWSHSNSTTFLYPAQQTHPFTAPFFALSFQFSVENNLHYNSIFILISRLITRDSARTCPRLLIWEVLSIKPVIIREIPLKRLNYHSWNKVNVIYLVWSCWEQMLGDKKEKHSTIYNTRWWYTELRM